MTCAPLVCVRICVYPPAGWISLVCFQKRGVRCLRTPSPQKKSTDCVAHNLIALSQNQPPFLESVSSDELLWRFYWKLTSVKLLAWKVSLTPDYCSCYVAECLKRWHVRQRGVQRERFIYRSSIIKDQIKTCHFPAGLLFAICYVCSVSLGTNKTC